MPSQTLACPACDLMIEVPVLSPGDEARCPRCAHAVARLGRGGLRASLALLLAAAVMYALALSFPFLAFESRGLSREIALWQVAGELFAQGMPVLGVGVAALVIVVPGLLLALHLGILAGVLGTARMSPLSVRLLRWSGHLSPWNMVEIFALGTLASLTKIASLATVVFGISFWAYLAFSALLSLSLLQFDRHRLWNLVRAPRPRFDAAGRLRRVEVLL